MSEYHKIKTLWNRDPENRYKTLIGGDWATPEFGYLQDACWIYTEKVDGANIRVIWDGEKVTFGGKTDRAQIPAELVNHLSEVFPSEKLAAVLKGPLVLYGEGYGPKIQKGGRYADSQRFIMFDALAGDVWLERETVEEIASDLGVPVVPTVGAGTLHRAVELVRSGFRSHISKDPELQAEGLVLRPAVELRDRRGHRVISKLKYRDFRR